MVSAARESRDASSRQPKQARNARQPAVKDGVEAGHLRELGTTLRKRVDRTQLIGQVRRGKWYQLVECHSDRRCDAHRPVEPSATVNKSVPYGSNVLEQRMPIEPPQGPIEGVVMIAARYHLVGVTPSLVDDRSLRPTGPNPGK